MLRYRDEYDRYITISLLHRVNDASVPIPQSFTDIYRMIAKLYPTVGKDTIQTHLDKLVDDKIIVRLQSEKRRYNKTLYVLSPKGLDNIIQVLNG